MSYEGCAVVSSSNGSNHSNLPLRGGAVPLTDPLTYGPCHHIDTGRGTSIMTRIIAALLAAASIAGVATPVAAQTKYFARERIVGMPKSAATTPPPSTGTTCGTVQLGYWNIDNDVTVFKSGKVALAENAAAWCNANKSKDFSGLCLWNAGTTYVMTGKIGPAAGLYGSQCG
jgi:hypothetical protein